MSAYSIPPDILAAYRTAIEEAMLIEGRNVLAEARKIVPYVSGALSNSGVVESVWSEDRFYVIVGFGTAPETAKYAEKQHENMAYKHPPGHQAKYLEVPALAANPGMDQRVATYVASKVQ